MWSDWLVVCDCGFSLSALWCPLSAPTVLLGFLLPRTWGISSRLLQQSSATASYLGHGLLKPLQPLGLEGYRKQMKWAVQKPEWWWIRIHGELPWGELDHRGRDCLQITGESHLTSGAREKRVSNPGFSPALQCLPLAEPTWKSFDKKAHEKLLITINSRRSVEDRKLRTLISP